MIPLNNAHRGHDLDIGISEYMDSYSRLAAAILTNAQFPPSKRFLNYKRYLLPESKYSSNEQYFDSEKVEEVLDAQTTELKSMSSPGWCPPHTLDSTSSSSFNETSPAQKTICVEVFEKKA